MEWYDAIEFEGPTLAEFPWGAWIFGFMIGLILGFVYGDYYKEKEHEKMRRM